MAPSNENSFPWFCTLDMGILADFKVFIQLRITPLASEMFGDLIFRDLVKFQIRTNYKFDFFSTHIPSTSQLFLPKLNTGPHSEFAPTGPDLHGSRDGSGVTVRSQFHPNSHLGTRKQCRRHVNAQFRNFKAKPATLHGEYHIKKRRVFVPARSHS